MNSNSSPVKKKDFQSAFEFLISSHGSTWPPSGWCFLPFESISFHNSKTSWFLKIALHIDIFGKKTEIQNFDCHRILNICIWRWRTLPNFFGFRAFYGVGSYVVTFSLRKGFCLVQHKILSSSWTSRVGSHVVREFCSCCCFHGKLLSQCFWRILKLLVKAWGKCVPFWAFYQACSSDVTFSLRKGFCFVGHKILSSSRTSNIRCWRTCCWRIS